MILADTSVWIAHIRDPDPVMAALLGKDQVVIHPSVIGELALGNLARRRSFIADLQDLKGITPAEDAEVMQFIEANALFGKGIGWVDAHLLASTLTDRRVRLWTRDRRLFTLARRFEIAFSPTH